MEGEPDTLDFVSARYDEDIEALITLIYHKCRLRITRDDPELVSYYIGCFTAGRLEVSMRQVMEDYVRRLSEVTEKVNADAVDKANKIVNGAIEASGKIVTAAIRDSASAIREESKKALNEIEGSRDAAIKSLDGKLNGAKGSGEVIVRTSRMALVASMVAAAAGVLALVVSFLR